MEHSGTADTPSTEPWPPRKKRDCLFQIRSSRAPVLVAAFIAFFLQCLLTSFVVPIVPTFLNETNTSFKVGVLLASNSFATVLVNPLVGYMVDYYGGEGPLALGFALFAVASFISGFADSIIPDVGKMYFLLLALRLIQNIPTTENRR